MGCWSCTCCAGSSGGGKQRSNSLFDEVDTVNIKGTDFASVVQALAEKAAVGSQQAASGNAQAGGQTRQVAAPLHGTTPSGTIISRRKVCKST